MNQTISLIEDENSLNEVMTRPGPPIIEFMRSAHNPLVILGAGGKMGPTLAVLARRAADAAGVPLDIVAVSRFTDPRARAFLETNGIKVLSLDLMERDAYGQLPDTENVIYMIGLKFGTAQNPANTWVMNTLIPAYASCPLTQQNTCAILTISAMDHSPVISVDHLISPGGAPRSRRRLVTVQVVCQ